MPTRKRFSALQDAFIIAERASGKPWDAIARVIGCARSCITERAIELGLSLKRLNEYAAEETATDVVKIRQSYGADPLHTGHPLAMQVLVEAQRIQL